MSKSRIGVGGAFFLYLFHSVLATPLWNPQVIGIGRNIRELPCVSRKTGETGTCMFAFSCAKANGTHLGTCIDRFYFGSCCKVPDNDLELVPPVEDNHLGEWDSTTTPRNRPAITQKPQETTGSEKPHTSPKPRPTSSKPHLTTTTFRPTSLKPSTSRPSVSSSRPQPSSSRPIVGGVKPSLTTPTPTLVTWTTLEESPSKKPTKPQVSTPSVATHKPILVNSSFSLPKRPSTTPIPARPSTNPGKPSTNPARPSTNPARPSTNPARPSTNPARPSTNPARPSTTTARPSAASVPVRPSTVSAPARPSTTHKPITGKPSVAAPQKPVSASPTNTTAKPEQHTTKPPSTTWIPVSVTTHAPSPQTTKIPLPSKKPTQPPTKRPTTTSQNVVNVLQVSSTAKPVPTSGKPPAKPTASNKPSISTTSRPVTAGSNRPQLVTSTSVRPPSRPPIISTTHRPSSTKRPSSTQRPSTTQHHTTSVFSSPSTSRPTTHGEPNEVSIGSSTALPVVQTTLPQSTTPSVSSFTSTLSSSSSTLSSSSTPSSSTSPSATTASTLSEQGSSSSTPPPEINEVESFNKTNYKEVCGRRLFPEARIVGGQVSGFGKWPWQISLRQWRTSTFLHKCGAALLNENWAITAAHCVENVPPSDLLLRLGEHDLSTEEEPYGYEERRVQIVASHPQFDPRTFEYDLALLRFYEPVTFQPNIIPVCVPEDDTNFVGSTAFVTGWGRLYEDGPLPSILQEVSVPVINNTLCETMYRAAGYIEHIPDIFICAGWKKGGFDSCEGDSGGPMVIQRPDRRWLLAGVISWGIGCAEPNQPGVYTRISQFRHWINQILQF